MQSLEEFKLFQEVSGREIGLIKHYYEFLGVIRILLSFDMGFHSEIRSSWGFPGLPTTSQDFPGLPRTLIC